MCTGTNIHIRDYNPSLSLYLKHHANLGRRRLWQQVYIFDGWHQCRTGKIEIKGKKKINQTNPKLHHPIRVLRITTNTKQREKHYSLFIITTLTPWFIHWNNCYSIKQIMSKTVGRKFNKKSLKSINTKLNWCKGN